MGFNPFSGRGLIAIGTLGGSELLGEETMSKVPLLGGLGGYKSDSEKALIRKQQELAAEAQKRQQAHDQARSQALAQSMLAFGPRNQAMAQMFGPEAAFSKDAMMQMAQSPFSGGGAPQLDPSLVGYQGMDPQKRGAIEQWAQQKKQWDANQAMMQQGLQDPRNAPQAQPLQRVAPQAGRRF